MRTVLLVTLVSVIGSLLAFDQFYIMTAGQPLNQTATSVFYVYLNSFPFLKLGYGAALSLILAVIILIFTVDADDPDEAEPGVTSVVDPSATGVDIDGLDTARPGAHGRSRPPRSRPADERTSSARSASRSASIMLLPIVASVLASVKPTAEAAQTPADLRPARLQPRRLPAALGVPVRAADLPHQQLRHRAADRAVHARA